MLTSKADCRGSCRVYAGGEVGRRSAVVLGFYNENNSADQKEYESIHCLHLLQYTFKRIWRMTYDVTYDV